MTSLLSTLRGHGHKDGPALSGKFNHSFGEVFSLIERKSQNLRNHARANSVSTDRKCPIDFTTQRGSINCAIEKRRLNDRQYTVQLLVVCHLPIPDAAVAIEHSLRQLLLKRMLFHFRFVDDEAETWASVGTHQPPLRFNGESFFDDVGSPGNVAMDGFADNVAGLREAKL